MENDLVEMLFMLTGQLAFAGVIIICIVIGSERTFRQEMRKAFHLLARNYGASSFQATGGGPFMVVFDRDGDEYEFVVERDGRWFGLGRSTRFEVRLGPATRRELDARSIYYCSAWADLPTPDLSPVVHSRLTAIRQVLAQKNRRLELDFDGLKMRMTVRGAVRRARQIDQLCNASIQLFDAVASELQMGITLDPGVPDAVVSLRCAVCGDSANAEHSLDWVACPTCRTPHHRECWAHSGGCSRYGCGERRNAAASLAAFQN